MVQLLYFHRQNLSKIRTNKFKCSLPQVRIAVSVSNHKCFNSVGSITDAQFIEIEFATFILQHIETDARCNDQGFFHIFFGQINAPGVAIVNDCLESCTINIVEREFIAIAFLEIPPRR